jgi:hypothetical protein
MQKSARNFLASLRLPAWTVPIALLVLCGLSYAVMLSKLGIYWDDWTIVYSIHFLGPSSFLRAYAFDRPLLAFPYILTSSILGEAPLGWQVFGVLARWLSCLALWWTLRILWPRRERQVVMVVVLFAVYPGFSQQYIAITYGNGFLVQALFFLSLGLMLLASRRLARFWPAFFLSVLFSGYAMFAAEYFFGLDLLRPVLLWLALKETVKDVRQRLRLVALYWLPYLLLMAAFLVWRLSTPTPRGAITLFDKLSAGLLAALFSLAKTVASDLFKVSILAWKQVFEFSNLGGYDPGIVLRYALIVVVTLALAIFYLAFLRGGERGNAAAALVHRRRWAFQALCVGAYAMFLGGAPIWATNLQIALFFPWDRFTLPMMLGVSLLLAGLIEVLPGFRWQGIMLVGMLAGLAAGFHYQNALSYRKEWLLQRDFFWQLSWRAPGIQPGTVILTTEMPFRYDTDNSLTSPLNWTYAPENRQPEFLYLLYNLESRLSAGLPALEAGEHISEVQRLLPFKGSTSQALAVIYNPPGCLKAIDPRYDQRLPGKPRYFRETLPFSNPDLILAEEDPEAQPPLYFFGPEPEHDWCYYFEKAELARQRGDWEQVAALGDQALGDGKSINRNNVAELVPFIEGYARTGRWERAVELSQEAYRTWENTRLMLCDVWRIIYQDGALDAQGQEAFNELQGPLQCKFSWQK